MKAKTEETRISKLDIDGVKSRMVAIRGQMTLLDRDVAELYGVATREINQAVRNNPGKFPEGYVVELDEEEAKVLRSKFLTLDDARAGRGRHSKYNYKVFTERGLYMLATILKGERAVRTTLAIIETYAQVRELARPASLEALAGRPIVHNSTRFSSAPRVANIPRYALHVHNALRRNQALSDPHLCPKPLCFSEG